MHEPSQPEREFVRFGVAGFLGLAGTFILFMYGIKSSPDVLRDEITYWIVSHNVAEHASVSLYGRPFFLHPPLFFLGQGAVLRIFGGPNSFLYGTLDIRWLPAVIGLLTACMILITSARAIGRLAALLSLTLYSLDPLVLRTVRRDLLEAPAMLMAVGAVFLLSESGEKELQRPALAGLFIGLALLTKEYTGFLLLLVIVQWLWSRLRWHWAFSAQGGLTTRQAATTLSVALCVYALYPLAWIVTGEGSVFISGKLSLLERFLGLVHATGLNRHGSHLTVVSTLVLNLRQGAPSYALLAVGAASALWLLIRSQRRGTSIIALWALVITGWTAFGTLQGAAEEGFYYYEIVPAAMTTGALLAHLTGSTRPYEIFGVKWSGRLLPVVGVTLATLFVAYNVGVWTRQFASPDNAVVQMRQYLDRSVPKRSLFIAGAEMDGPSFGKQQFRFIRLPGVSKTSLYQYKVLQPGDIRRLARGGAHYVIMSTKDVYVGYGLVSPGAAQYIHKNGTIIHSSYSTTYWHLQLIRLHARLPVVGAPTHTTVTRR